ncbi:hypothetical protein K469DRAFT_720260 [Zopfia rhizophila CBS 207.26]|uniref:Uncharacterized protein n=1 Tax=Zopfia rhizophila CBS 207.26 TaxID=1314779 RepID=A0A6A6EJF7_9PEZI|nr:hypothetical protein K469DRAFT_720260 [Zopfia rhizophila CBS 207.26]
MVFSWEDAKTLASRMESKEEHERIERQAEYFSQMVEYSKSLSDVYTKILEAREKKKGEGWLQWLLKNF